MATSRSGRWGRRRRPGAWRRSCGWRRCWGYDAESLFLVCLGRTFIQNPGIGEDEFAVAVHSALPRCVAEGALPLEGDVAVVVGLPAAVGSAAAAGFVLEGAEALELLGDGDAGRAAFGLGEAHRAVGVEGEVLGDRHHVGGVDGGFGDAPDAGRRAGGTGGGAGERLGGAGAQDQLVAVELVRDFEPAAVVGES